MTFRYMVVLGNKSHMDTTANKHFVDVTAESKAEALQLAQNKLIKKGLKNYTHHHNTICCGAC